MVSSKTQETPQQNLCAVLHGARDIRLETRSCPPPAPSEVQIQLKATGLCGSDLSYYTKGKNGNFALQEPLILGHEAAGIITAIGSEVPGFACLKVGQRIAIEAGIYCRDCERCKEGKYNLCKGMRFASSAKTFPHLDGSLQKFINWPYWLVHTLPETMSFTSGALLEPLCVVLQAFSRSNLKANERVLVLGAGAVGLLTCAAAKARGASSVVAIDIDQGRLSFAQRNGWADEVYQIPLPSNSSSIPQPSKSRAEEDVEMIAKAERSSETFLQSLKDQREFDVVYECTGVMSCVQLSIFATRPGGRVVLIGMGTPIQTLPIGASALREVDIQGVFRYANVYPEAIDLISSGRLEAKGENGIEQLRSHSFSLDKASEAFETLARGKGQDGKGVVKVFVIEE